MGLHRSRDPCDPLKSRSVEASEALSLAKAAIELEKREKETRCESMCESGNKVSPFYVDWTSEAEGWTSEAEGFHQ